MIIENKELGIRFGVKGNEDFEKWLAEHDKQIRSDAINDYTEWLRKAHANFDEDYAEDIKSDYLEQSKEQK